MKEPKKYQDHAHKGDYETYVKMPPKSKYTVKIKIIAVKKAEPKIDKGGD